MSTVAALPRNLVSKFHWKITRFQRWGLLSLLAAFLVWMDHLTGPLILFPITFALPIAFAVLWLGFWPAVRFALLMPTAQALLDLSYHHPIVSLPIGACNAVIRAAEFLMLAVLIDIVQRQQRLLDQRVQLLEGILPICSFCKKIRREDGSWESVESYVTAHSRARFSHGYCDDCSQRHFGV